MKLLEDKIKTDGKVLPGNILRVGSFMNHMIDTQLLDKMGEEFYELYKDAGVTKILTVEASGIAIAYAAARYFGCPLLFAKKNQMIWVCVSATLVKTRLWCNVNLATNNALYSLFFASRKKGRCAKKNTVVG